MTEPYPFPTPADEFADKRVLDTTMNLQATIWVLLRAVSRIR